MYTCVRVAFALLRAYCVMARTHDRSGRARRAVRYHCARGLCCVLHGLTAWPSAFYHTIDYCCLVSSRLFLLSLSLSLGTLQGCHRGQQTATPPSERNYQGLLAVSFAPRCHPRAWACGRGRDPDVCGGSNSGPILPPCVCANSKEWCQQC